MFRLYVLILASLLLAPPADAKQPRVERPMTYYLDGKIVRAKLSRIDVQYCAATAVMQEYEGVQSDQGTQEYTHTYFTTTEECHTGSRGVGFEGSFDDLVFVGTKNGLAVFTATAYASSPPMRSHWNAPVDTEVALYDDTELTIRVDRKIVVVRPWGPVYLTSRIAGDGVPYVRMVCGQSGCGAEEELPTVWRFLSNGFQITPGTAVTSIMGTVGMYYYGDGNKSAFVPIEELWTTVNDLVYAGVDGKG